MLKILDIGTTNDLISLNISFLRARLSSMSAERTRIDTKMELMKRKRKKNPDLVFKMINCKKVRTYQRNVG